MEPNPSKSVEAVWDNLPHAKNGKKMCNKDWCFYAEDIRSIWKKNYEKCQRLIQELKSNNNLDPKEIEEYKMEIDRLQHKLSECEKTIRFMDKNDEKSKQLDHSMEELFNRFLQILSGIANHQMNDENDQKYIENSLENLKLITEPLGFKLYRYKKGDTILPEERSSVSPNQGYYEKTNNKELDQKVFSCDCMGFRMDSLGLLSTAQVTLYQYIPDTEDNNINNKTEE